MDVQRLFSRSTGLEAFEEFLKLLNLGNEKAYSVREILSIVEKVTGLSVPTRESPRREGDAEVLIADSSKAKKVMGWVTKYSNIETIVKTAVDWHSKCKNRQVLKKFR